MTRLVSKGLLMIGRGVSDMVSEFKGQDEQRTLVDAVLSNPSEDAQILHENLHKDYRLNSPNTRLNIYRNDYYARLVNVGLDAILAPLLKLVEKESLVELIKYYLSSNKNHPNCLDRVFDEFPNFLRTLERSDFLDELIQLASCAIEYWHFTWTVEPRSYFPVNSQEVDWNHVYLREDCYLFSSPIETSFLGLFEDGNQEQSHGILFFKRTPQLPGVMSIDSCLMEFCRSLGEGVSFERSLEYCDDNLELTQKHLQEFVMAAFENRLLVCG